jgi:hypothetical protein
MPTRNQNTDDRSLLKVLHRLLYGLSEEAKVAICALLALPAGQYFHVDPKLCFWLTFAALGSYFSLRLVRLMPK